ncbi:RAD52 motif-containing protein 1-like isoform X3 [Mesoplodon densirostris]|uniref:RAD52 motif-containing protein 1-like isoform X3 n=1 Tax=Mesoplodon densirostris TaxID=48708 RepID=UPI0028DD07CD|nr:RAD52 motif-containing protein 1-like isoform X3 [Mesoplodon densirostris]
MWDLPGPGHEAVSPASAGSLSTTPPPGKPARVVCAAITTIRIQNNVTPQNSLMLQDLSNLEERENEAIVTPIQKQSLKFFCALEVVLPSHKCRRTEVVMAEEPLDKLEEGSLSFLMERKVTQKLAVQKAMTDAFQKLLIVALESGKIAVACRPCEEVTDARTEEELQDLIQVSYFSCQPCSQREEECLSDFSFEEEEFRLPELD